MIFKAPSSQIIPPFHRHDPADCKHVRTRLQPRAVSVTQLWKLDVCPIWNVTGHSSASGGAERRDGRSGRPFPAPQPRSRCSQSLRPRPALSRPPTAPDEMPFPCSGSPARSRLSPRGRRRGCRGSRRELRAAGREPGKSCFPKGIVARLSNVASSRSVSNLHTEGPSLFPWVAVSCHTSHLFSMASHLARAAGG